MAGLRLLIGQKSEESRALLFLPPYSYANSLEKILMLGKTEGKRRTEWQRMGWLDGITDSMDMNLNKLGEIVKDRRAWHAALHGVTKSQT